MIYHFFAEHLQDPYLVTRLSSFHSLTTLFRRSNVLGGEESRDSTTCRCQVNIKCAQ